MIIILPSEQKLYHLSSDGIDIYPISTSKFGLGSEDGSYRTPTGLHRISHVYGLDQPIYTRFIARAAQEVIKPDLWASYASEDLILSKILRLEGCEPGLNQGAGIDSFTRFIYIHGTNQEHLIGQTASIGCIRMLNVDIELLSRKVHCGTEVGIGDHYAERIPSKHLSSKA